MARLTRRTVEATKPDASREFVVWDEELKGFGLRVRPSGLRTYVVQYRTGGGRSRRISLGSAAVLTPDEARHLARQKLAEVAMGRDPADEKAALRAAATVKDLAERFEREHIATKLKPSTAYTYRRLIKDKILPALRSKKVADLTRDDVATFHHQPHEMPRQANQTIAVLSKMITMAEIWEMRREGANPCRHIQRFPERKNDRFLSNDELIRVGKALTDMEGEGKITPFVALLFRLILLTGCRVSEVLTLRWDHVYLDQRQLRLAGFQDRPEDRRVVRRRRRPLTTCSSGGR
jgi:integrase